MLARAAASAAAAPWIATTVCAQQVRRLVGAEVRGEAQHRRGAGKGHEIDPAIEQLPVDVDVRIAVVDDFGAVRAQQVGEIVGLLVGVHHQRAAPEQRPRIEPAQVLAEIDHPADDQQAGADRLFLQLRGQRAKRAGDGALRRQRALQDDGGGLVRRSSVIDQRPQHLGQLLRPGVRDDRAVQLGERGPVDAGLFAAFILMPANERDRVAAAGIGDRHAGVGAGADRVGHARHHFVLHALFVQEQRFLAALVEQERIAPLQPRDGLALARLLGEQEADRILIARLRRGAANVDALGMLGRDCEQVGMHEVIEDHHVGFLQAAKPAQGNQVGRAGSGADHIDDRFHTGILQGLGA